MLKIEDLRPHLGNLNWILKDYGISVQVVVEDDGSTVHIVDGKADVKIGPNLEWIEGK